MSTTVTYKGETLTTVNNQTRTLLTSGKYLEDNITLTDVSGGGGGTVTIIVNNFYGVTATPDTATVTQDEFYNWVVTIPKHSLFIINGGMDSTPAGTNVTVGEVFTQSRPPAYYYYVQTGDVDGGVNA